MFKKIKIGVFIGLLLILLVKIINVFQILLRDSEIYHYEKMLGDMIGEVYSSNFVTGIYLDYRLYDSIFEATILFAVATGIIFMVRKDIEMIEHLSIKRIKILKK
ncbi:MAG: hypothetical protein JW702_00115 [Clostridiales bacterium]|nr:hypothetical protein [Clostridiales bacterium]